MLPCKLPVAISMTPTVVWWDAQSHCESLGASLITINDAEESQLVNLITGCEDVNAWIGLTNDPHVTYGGTWAWSSGEEMSFTQWHIGEPNDSPYSDVATLTSWDGRMGWAASDGYDYHGFICEGVPPTSAPTTAAPSSAPTITPVPSAPPAPTIGCLVDDFDGTSLGSQWTDRRRWRRWKLCRGQRGDHLSDTSHVRSVGSFTAPLIIRATSTLLFQPLHQALDGAAGRRRSSWYEPGVVTFWWWCTFEKSMARRLLSTYWRRGTDV